jgi:hypothetical protein
LGASLGGALVFDSMAANPSRNATAAVSAGIIHSQPEINPLCSPAFSVVKYLRTAMEFAITAWFGCVTLPG